MDEFLIQGEDQHEVNDKLFRVLAKSREIGLKVWEPQQEAFDNLKSVITSSPALAYFDKYSGYI